MNIYCLNKQYAIHVVISMLYTDSRSIMPELVIEMGEVSFSHETQHGSSFVSPGASATAGAGEVAAAAHGVLLTRIATGDFGWWQERREPGLSDPAGETK